MIENVDPFSDFKAYLSAKKNENVPGIADHDVMVAVTDVEPYLASRKPKSRDLYPYIGRLIRTVLGDIFQLLPLILF